MIHEHWSISLSRHRVECKEASLRSLPRILAICPEPGDGVAIAAAVHVAELRELLKGPDFDLGTEDNFQVARTWDAVIAAMQESHYDVVYYFGRGESKSGSAQLAFEGFNGDDGTDLRTVRDLVRCIRRNMRSAPTVCYLNVCSGSCDGIHSSAAELSGFVPSVVAPRVVTCAAVARKQAVSFFRQILLDSHPPHQSVAWLSRDLADSDWKNVSPEWYAPLHFCGYSEWHHVSPKTSGQRIHRHWKSLLDRRKQYALTVESMRQILRRDIKKRAYAIVVHGDAGEGLEHFRERIRVAIHDSTEVDGKTYAPQWPRHAMSRTPAWNIAWCHKVIESCRFAGPDDFAKDLRRGVSGSRTLIAMNHSIVADPNVLKSEGLAFYLNWWNQRLSNELADDDLFFLFAFFFEVKPQHSADFQEKMRSVGRQRLQHVHMDVLDPLESVNVDDLVQFIDDHGLVVPGSPEKAADQIMETSDGVYQKAIEELTRVVRGEFAPAYIEKDGSTSPW